MSLIERVADMLGQLPQPGRKPMGAPAGTDNREPGLIERAISNKAPISAEFTRDADVDAGADDWTIGNKSRRPEPGKNKDFEAGPDVVLEPPVVPHRVSRTLKVNLDLLRRQNILTPDGARSPIAEGFRRVKRQILAKVANPEAGAARNLIMVTSPLPGEGKTFCAVNLAISMAMEMDRTVLLVDADVAKPSIPRLLGIDAELGLMDVLLDRNIDLSDVLCKTDIDKLSVLPAGTRHQHATELLASEAMNALVQEMARRYHDRILIFDSPPLLAASEAGVLASRMGQIVMVVEAGKTTETVLKDALSRIESCNLAGLVLNKGMPQGSGYYSEYGYGYGYGS